MQIRVWPSFVLLVLLVPFLQGAGCRTHYSARLHGTVAPAAGLSAEHAGKAVRVIYRRHQADTTQCTTDWVPCLQQPTWQPLHGCDALPEDQGKAATADLAAADTELRFDACTQMIGVDYHADVAAFVDVDGDGQLGPGEPYGVYEGNPLWRDKEATALPLSITIDQTMPAP